MKRLLLLCLIFALWGCQKSLDQQAQEAVRSELYKTLLNFDSYEPLETKVDSAFNGAECDPNFIELVYKMNELGTRMNQVQKDLEKAEGDMAIYEEPRKAMYGNAYASYNYNKALKEKEEATKQIQILQKQAVYLARDYHELASSWDKSFKGWLVKHKYRAKNNGGQSIIATHCFVFSQDFKKCMISEEEENFKNLLQMAEYMKKTAKSKEELQMAIDRLESSKVQ